jgi:hypothetical protein
MTRAPLGSSEPPPPPDRPDRLERIAAAVAGCPLVAGLSPGASPPLGRPGGPAGPGPGVDGVAVTPRGVEIAVIGRFGATVAAIAEQVRAAALAVEPAVGLVDVRIEDLALAEPALPEPPPAEAAPAAAGSKGSGSKGSGSKEGGSKGSGSKGSGSKGSGRKGKKARKKKAGARKSRREPDAGRA